MKEVDLKKPISVEIDVPITRRIKLHAVVNANGRQIFHSRRISEVFTFLVEHEVGQFTMIDEDAEFRVTLRPPLAADPPKKG